MFFSHDGFFVAVDPNIQLPSIIHHEIFGALASTQPDQVLFICFACICLCLTTKLVEMEFGTSVNTVSEEAHGLSDPPVNLHGGCRGHCRGQRSAFMHITNNASFLPTAKADSTGSSHETASIKNNKYLSNVFYKQKVLYCVFVFKY